MNFKKTAFMIFSFFLLIFFYGCGELIKKNEEEFTGDDKSGFMGLNFLMNSQDFASMPQNLMAVTNDKRHLYTCNDGANTTIYVFDINYPGSVFNRRAVAYTSRHLAISRDDRFLYTTDGGFYIYIYKINDDGSLTYKSQLYDSMIGVVRQIEVSPNNGFLYVLCSYAGINSVVWYKRDIESGRLGSVRYLNTIDSFDRFAFSPDARFFYLSSMSTANFECFEVDYKNGNLNYKNSMAVMSNSFCISGDGSYLYLSNGANVIDLFERDKGNGSLKYITAVGTAISINSIHLSPDSRTLYALTGAAASNIEIFPISNSGKFSGYNVYSNGSALNYPVTMDFGYGGRFLYVLNTNSMNIAVFGTGGK